MFSEHQLVRVILGPYKLVSSDQEAEHRLLVDRQHGTLEVGLARDVEQLLATQPSELRALIAHLSTEQAQTLLERAMQDQLDRRAARTPAQHEHEIRGRVERETELLNAMKSLLDRERDAIEEPVRPPEGRESG